MSKYLSIKEAKNKLEELPSQLNDEPIIITQEGKPVMITISYEQYESIMETLSILTEQTFANKLQQSI
jgi:prevent-host-death family protein